MLHLVYCINRVQGKCVIKLCLGIFHLDTSKCTLCENTQDLDVSSVLVGYVLYIGDFIGTLLLLV